MITTFITARNEVGQGNIFTGVYDSVNRGVSDPEGGVWWLLLGGLVPGGVCSRGGVPSGGRRRMATAAGGTHPTGMHSCYFLWSSTLQSKL